ncbi:MAG TPA: hypothetical protein PKB06_02350, partial [Actinotalea sp.]|nr:hypothetical protein [Actinotalea sp.]
VIGPDGAWLDGEVDTRPSAPAARAGGWAAVLSDVCLPGAIIACVIVIVIVIVIDADETCCVAG